MKRFLSLLIFSLMFIPQFYDNGECKTVSSYEKAKSVKIDVSKRYIDSISKIISPHIQIENQLIECVDSHVNNKIISEHIVKAGIKNNIDICFIMAQANIETSYGKAGVGKTKNNLFGIAGKSYKSYKHSIDDYCDILTKYYLVNGKTESHLMRNYVNKNGYRYAKSRSYETHLCSKYNDIVKKSPNILILQEKYARYMEQI